MPSDGQAMLRTMFFRQAVVIATLIILAVLGHLSLVQDFSQAVDDGGIINNAGRQRMLVQKISALNFDIALASDVSARERYLQDLGRALSEFDGIYAALLGDRALRPLSAETRALLHDGSPSLDHSLRDFIDFEHAVSSVGISVGMGKLISNHDRVSRTIVPGLDAVVGQLQAEARSHARRFYLNILIGDIALAALLTLSWIKIFNPMLGRLRSEISNVENARNLMASMLDTALDAIITVDLTGRIVTFNRSAEIIFGHREIDVLGQNIADLIIPTEHREAHLRGLERIASGQPSHVVGKRLELTARTADHRIIPAELTITFLEDQALFTAFIRDLTEVKEARASVDWLLAAMENAPLSVVITNLDATIQYVNAAFTVISGYQKHEAIGSHSRILKSGLTAQSTYDDLWSTILEGKVWRGELVNRRKNGNLFHENAVIFPVKNSEGRDVNFIAIKEDITRQKEYLARISDFESRDQVTGLPNRRSVFEHISERAAQAQGPGSLFAVCVIRVGTFNEVVQSYGHAVADSFIASVADRLVQVARPADVVARAEGDTFIAIVTEIASRAIAESVANTLLSVFARSFACSGHKINAQGNLGIAYCPDHGRNPEELVRHAATAAARAEAMGNNLFRVFVPDMDQQALEERQLEGELIRAIDNGDIRVHYQPLIASSDRNVAGAEALARWTSPTFGPVRPDRFIALAERRGLIRPLGALVLTQACRDAVRFRAQTDPKFVMAVNTAAQQIEDITFAEQVGHIIDAHGLPAENLEIEITERSLVGKSPHVSAQIDILRSMGHGLSIDDFGTGYSALSYLRQYPFTTLKIDQSFVAQLGRDSSATSLVVAIIRMAQSLGLEIVAEGVETGEHATFLTSASVDRLQGYYFAKPMPAEECLLWMADLQKPQVF